MDNVFHEVVICTNKELNEFANSSKQKFRKYIWEWILRVWNNGKRNIKLHQAEFIGVGALKGGSSFVFI